ncbi:MAG: YggS family pyridoxal phosphate-dependent enzyme [Casimicrobium sp.]
MTASFDASQAIAQVRARIVQACALAQRESDEVRLLAVSKLQTTDKIRHVYAAGQRAFGENYVQEAVEKTHALSDLSEIEWHLIGPLQSNKTREVAQTMHWVHSVDRLKIAERLSAQRPASMPPLNVCVQFNISGEASKSGASFSDADALIDAVAQLPSLTLRGVMGMPEPGIGDDETRKQFLALRDVFERAKKKYSSVDTFSIGMSDDLEIAIACGSTMVRVGTALFGARPTRL